MTPTVIPPGTTLKNQSYQIDRLLGQGGFGAVYLAYDLLLENKKCAIKESYDQSPGAQKQFELEARILANLNHPNLVRVTDNFIEPSGKMYLVMEFIEGEDLEKRLTREGALKERDVLTWMDQILAAVEYLHAHQPRIVHRDIKPANIRVLPNGSTAKLVDFGIAKVGGKAVLTQSVARGVTDGYSPPEQYGSGTDTYSDVYALGATMYTLLTGVEPPISIDRKLNGVNLIAPRALNPAITQETEAVILRALAVDHAGRYQTASEMRQALAPMTTCPHCHQRTRASARFCMKCGQLIQAPVSPALPPLRGQPSTSGNVATTSLAIAYPVAPTPVSTLLPPPPIPNAPPPHAPPTTPRSLFLGAGIGAGLGFILGYLPSARFQGGLLVTLALYALLLMTVSLGAMLGVAAAARLSLNANDFLIRLLIIYFFTAVLTLLLGGLGLVIGQGAFVILGVFALMGAILGAVLGLRLSQTKFFQSL